MTVAQISYLIPALKPSTVLTHPSIHITHATIFKLIFIVNKSYRLQLQCKDFKFELQLLARKSIVMSIEHRPKGCITIIIIVGH